MSEVSERARRLPADRRPLDRAGAPGHQPGDRAPQRPRRVEHGHAGDGGARPALITTGHTQRRRRQPRHPAGAVVRLGETGAVKRVLLVRRGEHQAEARELPDDGAEPTVTRLDGPEVAEFVRDGETGSAPVRWVWDDTTRWYPALLAAGVRVERCTDLRLCHAVLRRSPFVDQALLAGDGDRRAGTRCSRSPRPTPALFPLEDPADRARPGRRARPAAARRWPRSPERGRLGLLLAAESSGALVAAEMTLAGLPWRADVHERLLTELLGPRPAAGQRPAVLERLAAEIRDGASQRPGAEPRLAGRAAAGAADRGAAGDRHPLVDARAARPPRHPGAARVQEAVAAAAANGWSWLDTWVARRPVPAVLPARRRRHRAVGVQRRRSAVGPGPGAARGGRRRRLAVRRRRRRPARTAGAGRR